MIREKILKDGKKKFYADFKKADFRAGKTFSKRSEAKTWLAQMEIKHNRKELSNKTPFFKDVFQGFIDGKHNLSPKSKSQYVSDFKNYYNPLFEKVRINNINDKSCNELQEFCVENELQPRSINAKLIRFRTIIKFAVDRQIIRVYPFSKMEGLKVTKDDFVFWNKKEIIKFLKLDETPEKLFFQILLNSGMRLGELAGLEISKVDFERKLIRVNRSLKNWNSQARESDKLNLNGRILPFILGETKTSSSNRNIPLTKTLATLFKALINNRKSGLVYESKGKPIAVNNANQRVFLPLQKEAGIKTIINIHDLRHTFASHFVMNGGHLYVLKSILGHKDYETTTIYAHLSPVHELNQMSIIKFE